jgi:hypothetical protein
MTDDATVNNSTDNTQSDALESAQEANDDVGLLLAIYMKALSQISLTLAHLYD